MTTTTDSTPRFDVKAIAVDTNGVHYGRVIAYGVTIAIGPARNGWVLVTDGVHTLEVMAAQLFRSA